MADNLTEEMSSMPQEDRYLINASGTEAMPPTGSEIRFDLQLSPAPAPSNRVVQGTVTDETGTPVPSANVKVLTSSYAPIAHTDTNPQGHYIFNQLDPGTYVITAAKQGFLTPVAQSFTLGQTGTLVINITLPHHPPGINNTSIFGVVTALVGGAPIPNATVIINSVDELPQETLFATTTTGTTGQYFSINMLPGLYTVQVQAEGYVTSPKITTSIALNEFIPVNFALSIDPEEAEGTVSGLIKDVNNQPLPYAFVALYEVTPQGEQIVQLTRTQSNGLYLFSDVTPNKTYRVKAKVVNIPPIP